MDEMSYEALPNEILKLIFENLAKEGQYSQKKGRVIKEDVKTCLSVCKRWQYVALEFFSEKHEIHANEDTLQRLLNDVASFGHKIESITVYESIKTPSPDRKKYSVIWYDILLLCPNLISVYFNFMDIFHYVRVVNDGVQQLDYFQFFDTFNLSHCNFATRQAYLQLCLKYHTTITSLSIVRLDDIPNYIEFNDFIDFIRQFPKLINLYLLGKGWRPPISNIDIHRLLEAVPQLKRFEMRGFRKVSIDSLVLEDNSDDDATTVNYSKSSDMFRLCIEVIEMDIKTLEYIATSYTGRRIEAADGYESREYEVDDVTEITGFSVPACFCNDDDYDYDDMSSSVESERDYGGLGEDESSTTYEIQTFDPMNVNFE
ncbi:hypothetical protein BD770DRAFT_429492 [Pilaira anomala]|nr:hypothetical protein BD770DRAFT_429492 [Pilaira anomala]